VVLLRAIPMKGRLLNRLGRERNWAIPEIQLRPQPTLRGTPKWRASPEPSQIGTSERDFILLCWLASERRAMILGKETVFILDNPQRGMRACCVQATFPAEWEHITPPFLKGKLCGAFLRTTRDLISIMLNNQRR
jgi:hypothetical protein